MKRAPLISVLMPAYNAQEFLKTAIDSILNQTFRDFELIIINDGSTDNTESIILSYQDDRIRMIKNPRNQGIVPTLNTGIDNCRGQYIARMDADDIAVAHRLEKQFNFMVSHPDIALCGSQAHLIDADGRIKGSLHTPTTDEMIKASLLFSTSFIHPTTMFKADVFQKYRYNKEYQYAEDYFLFTEISSHHPVANLNDFLLYYRDHSKNTTNSLSGPMYQAQYKVLNSQYNKFFGASIPTELLNKIHSFCNWDLDKYPLSEYQSMLEMIKEHNTKVKIHDAKALNKLLFDKWYLLIMQKGKTEAFFRFINSSLFEREAVTAKQLRKVIKISFFNALRFKIEK